MTEKTPFLALHERMPDGKFIIRTADEILKDHLKRHNVKSERESE